MRSIHPEPARDHVTLGTNIVYAAIHQFGGTAGRGAHMPKREYLGIRDDDWPKINAVFERYFTRLAQS